MVIFTFYSYTQSVPVGFGRCLSVWLNWSPHHHIPISVAGKVNSDSSSSSRVTIRANGKEGYSHHTSMGTLCPATSSTHSVLYCNCNWMTRLRLISFDWWLELRLMDKQIKQSTNQPFVRWLVKYREITASGLPETHPVIERGFIINCLFQQFK